MKKTIIMLAAVALLALSGCAATRTRITYSPKDGSISVELAREDGPHSVCGQGDMLSPAREQLSLIQENT